MILRKICSPSEVEGNVDYYENLGYRLDSKISISDTETELVFSGASSSHIGIAAHFDKNTEAFLEFPDGTVSKLYVRRYSWSDD